MKFFYFFKNHYNWNRVFDFNHLWLGTCVIVGLLFGVAHKEFRTPEMFLGLFVLTPLFVSMSTLLLGAVIDYLRAIPRTRGYIPVKRYPGYDKGLIWTPQELQLQSEYFEGYPKDKEVLVASAVCTPDGTAYAVMRPGRHFHCIALANEAHPLAEFGTVDTSKQGFMTNTNRYVDRTEGRLIAERNMGVTKFSNERHVFSEDLWDTPEHLKWKPPVAEVKKSQ